MRIWRIVPAEFAGNAYSGANSERAPGRWHNVPRRVVYATTTPELAILEKLVWVRRLERLEGNLIVPAEIPDSAVAVAQNHPDPWDEVPHSPATRSFGDAWLAAAESWALQVPSALSPGSNVLLNPLHPDHPKLVQGQPIPISRALIAERAVT